MSYIDCFKHTSVCLLSLPGYKIPVYRLNEETKKDGDFYAKSGDIVIGGGSGEHDGLVINLEATKDAFFKDLDDWEDGDFELKDVIRDDKWTNRSKYFIFKSMEKVGWTPDMNFEMFYGINLIIFLAKNYPKEFGLENEKYLSYEEDPDIDGSIYVAYTEEDKKNHNWWNQGTNTALIKEKYKIREERIKKILNGR